MIGQFERYHGAVIRELIVIAGKPIKIEARDALGRVNAFVLNDETGIYIKHSAKRLPTWQFTYNAEHIEELDVLSDQCVATWLIHVCGQDGLVTISLDEFFAMNPRECETTSFVRVDRDRNSMYRLNGTGFKLDKSKRRGLAELFET